MDTSVISAPSAFYARFLMSRHTIRPADYGIDMERDNFIDMLCDDFNEHVRGTLTMDEMLLRPRTALHFCDTVRAKHLWHDLPDDIILRAIMQRRKNPGG